MVSYILIFDISALLFLSGCERKETAAYETALSEYAEYFYEPDSPVRCTLIDLDDKTQMFAVSMMHGFDLYVPADKEVTRIGYIGTFGDGDTLYINPKSGVIVAEYHGEREIFCVISIRRENVPVLLQTVEKREDGFYMDVTSVMRNYRGERIVSGKETDEMIDTSSLFNADGEKISESEFDSILALNDLTKISYEEMRLYKGSAHEIR